jgi:hypothetical protein
MYAGAGRDCYRRSKQKTWIISQSIAVIVD